tara:strand:+ start:534 stop:791 length:258 start_codon:yes stop_codon:yes gene_type:complete
MVVSSVLHGSDVTGVKGISKSLASSANVNRAVYLNNRNINKISSIGVPSTTSNSLLSNGFYYGLPKSTILLANAKISKSMNKKKY